MFKKIVVGLFLLVALFLCAIGGYFYYQHQSKQKINHVIEQLAPLMDIHLDSVNISYEGQVELKNIDIAPVGYQDRILIESLKYTQTRLLDSVFNIFSNSEKPLNLKLSLTGIIADFNADFVRDNLRDSERGKTLLGLACADNQDFFDVIQNLGLSKTQSNAVISLALNDSKEQFRAALSANVQSLFNLLFEFELQSPVPMREASTSVLQKVNLSNMLLSVSDKGLNIRRLKYCAEQAKVPQARYAQYLKESVKLHMPNVDQIKDEDLEKSILNMFKPKMTALFDFNPAQKPLLASVFDNKVDIIQSKDLSLRVSGEQAATTYLYLLREKNMEIQLPQSVKYEQEIIENIKEKAIAQQVHTPKYTNIEMSELESLQGKEIRLRTVLGKEIDGVLIDVEKNKIIMQRRIQQGVVTYPVDKKAIASLKVFR